MKFGIKMGGVCLAMGVGALVMGAAYVTAYERITGKCFDHNNPINK